MTAAPTPISAREMPAPQIPAGWTLKAFKEMKSLSEETRCFSAKLQVDGKLVCEASNHGHGGPNSYHWLDASAAAQVEATAATFSEFDFEQLDDVIERMIGELELGRQAARIAKKGFAVVVLAEDAAGGFLFGLHGLANLGSFLARHKALSYRILLQP